MRGTPFFYGMGTTMIKHGEDRHGASRPQAKFDSFGIRLARG